MDKEKLILEFVKDRAGEILISDTDEHTLYRNGALDFSEEQWQQWLAHYLSGSEASENTEWEITDSVENRKFRVHSGPVTQGDERFIMHHVYDVSEDFSLLRELSQYSFERKQMANFQRELMERLSGSVSDCLPVIVRFLDVDEAVLCVHRGDLVETYQMINRDAEICRRTEEYGCQFMTPREEWVRSREKEPKHYLCYMNESTVDGQQFAVYLRGDISTVDGLFPMQYQVVRLFIENAMLREKVIYESEHDTLTQLYNKGKYLSMMEEFFPTCERIAVYNMDVNYLKRLNDSQGHEAGDKLLIKAAQSLIPFSGDRVAAFRMGGDEFAMIAWDLSEADAEDLLARWRQHLDELNRADDGIECIIACGMVYGGPGHDLDAMMKEADERMYRDKTAIKLSSGDDPDGR
ncbi:MAG: GGDEF domain-containing protein [Lachnospiraceae bacterium]|nr:GGDEF domain-containing protein [Lachnospiraceae bacterium]